MDQLFRKIAQYSSKLMGSPWAFIIATLSVVLWALFGPLFNYSDTWQLVINTATTVLTFLAVFLIQNTQNRDAHAIHLKLDEVIRSIKRARNDLIDIEEMEDAQIEAYQNEFRSMRQKNGNPPA